MRLEQMKYLIEIDRYKSMNIASKYLHVTQQNLSSAIKQLENELQLTLFERTSKGVELTEDGQYIVQLGKEIVEKAKAIEAYSQARNQQQPCISHMKGKIYLSISPYFARTQFPILVSQFCEQYQEVDIEVYVESSLEILRKISEGRGDLGLVNISENYLSQAYFDLEEINKMVLNIDKLVVLAHKKSEIGKHKTVSIKRLLDQRLLFYKNDVSQNDWLLELFLKFGQPKAIVKSNSVEFCIANLRDNSVLAPMANKAAQAFIQSEDIIKISIRPRIDIYNLLITKKQRQITDVEQQLIQMIKDADF